MTINRCIVVFHHSSRRNMAAGQTTTKSSTIVTILHLVFTVVSIAVLSYKVYHVESELSFLRDELSTRDRSDGLTKSTAAPISEHSRSERRSDRNRRRDHRDAYGNGVSARLVLTRTSMTKTTSTKQNINADCP